jgi:hypothetical protein
MRRRLREQLRVREALLLDLGALVYELHRQGKRAPELLQQKAAELTVVDEEVRELQAVLDGGDEPARETTEVDAVAGYESGDEALDEERPEDRALEGEPGDEGALDGEAEADGEREGEGELREDELDEEDESGGESEHRREHELGEEHELGDTGELDALAEEDEHFEGGDPEDGGREYEDSYDAPLVEREEPRG